MKGNKFNIGTLVLATATALASCGKDSKPIDDILTTVYKDGANGNIVTNVYRDRGRDGCVDMYVTGTASKETVTLPDWNDSNTRLYVAPSMLKGKGKDEVSVGFGSVDGTVIVFGRKIDETLTPQAEKNVNAQYEAITGKKCDKK